MMSELDERIAETSAGLPMHNYRDLLQIAWRRKSLLALGIVVALVGGSFYYVQSIPIYKSEAQVLVVKKRADVVTGEVNRLSHFDDYVATHRILIQSPLIVQQAIQRANLRSLKCFAGEKDDLAEA